MRGLSYHTTSLEPMSASTHFHRQLLDYLRQYSHACDLRHLKALSWMVSALICSGQLSLPAWEAYVPLECSKSAEC